MSKYLEKNQSLSTKYDHMISDMEKTDIVVEVPTNAVLTSNPVLYMPRRLLVRESAVSTSIWPVFDGSTKGYNGVSLNNCMQVSPCLLGNLT